MRLEQLAPKVAGLLTEAEDDLVAFYAMPAEHWSKLRSTNPLERVNREIGRRSDVVGIFPNDAALLRLAASLLIEQNDDWLVGRRYLSEGSMALVLGRGEAPELVPAPEGLPAAVAEDRPHEGHDLPEPPLGGRRRGAQPRSEARARRGGVLHPPDRAVRRAHCGALACGSVASGPRRGTLTRSIPV